MRIWVHKSAVAVILVMTLLLSITVTVSAETQPTETAMPTQIVEATAPAESPTVAPAEAPTEPDDSKIQINKVNAKSAIFQLCDELAQNMEARQIIVYDTNTDTILYTKSVETDKLYPASVTKLFSAYVALQYLDPDAIITAGDELDLVHEGSSMAFVSQGSQVYVKMIIEGMMLPSGNDAAMVLAAAAGRAIAQDENLPAADAVQEFVNEMNRQADALGFEKTHFVNPDGWHSGSHYTCLADMARIAKLALENKTIRRYMQMHKDETNFVSGQTVIWENTNLLLNPTAGYYNRDAIGMKTGYTRPAGYCLMSAFTFEEGEIVVGLFGYVNKYARFDDAEILFEACRDQLWLELLQAVTSVG